MNTYIVLLRGINVGGHKKVPMAELRSLLSEKGFEHVQTYIQSGNIILQSAETKEAVEVMVFEAIKSHFGFEVPVIVRTRTQLLSNFEACPFSNEKKENSYFIFLSDAPEKTLIKEVMSIISYENETYNIINDCLYFYSSIGYGKSKFNMNAFEKHLQVKATSRNYKTVVKLINLSE